MSNKTAYTVAAQVALLKQRGMLFRDEPAAYFHLANINYYRLRAYWWDMQSDYTQHIFQPDTQYI